MCISINLIFERKNAGEAEYFILLLYRGLILGFMEPFFSIEVVTNTL